MSPPASPTDVRGDLALVRGALSKAFELSESCDGMLELLAGLASPASDASARAQLGHKVLQAAELARATLRGLKAGAPRLEAARLRAAGAGGTASGGEAQHAAAALAHAQAAESAFACEWRRCSGGAPRGMALSAAGGGGGGGGGGAAEAAAAGALRAAAVALQGRSAALAFHPPAAAAAAAAAALPASDAALCAALRSTGGLWVVHPGRCVLAVALAPGVWPPRVVRVGAFGSDEPARWRSPWAHSRHKVFAGVAERATRAAAALQADPARPAAPGGALAQLLRLLGDHAALFTATKGGKVLAGSNAQPQLPHGAQRELAHQGP